MKNKLIDPTWSTLADAFREEMKEYGGLLNLLEEQQDVIFQRDPGKLMEKTVAINNEVEVCTMLRNKRKFRSDFFSAEFNLSSDYKIRELILYMPQSLQSMFDALINEVNDLIKRIKHKLSQNNLLLSRASELNNELIALLNPQDTTKMYSNKGEFEVKTPLQRGACITVSA